MITLTDYLMGRREQYPLAFGPDIEREALRTVDLANKLLDAAALRRVQLTEVNPRTGSLISSGWRPPQINATTANAAPRSLHMTGQAVDLYDPDGELDDWLMTDAGQAELARLGLWMEHPGATKSWSHLQTKPPRSGRRVFWP